MQDAERTCSPSWGNQCEMTVMQSKMQGVYADSLMEMQSKVQIKMHGHNACALWWKCSSASCKMLLSDQDAWPKCMRFLVEMHFCKLQDAAQIKMHGQYACALKEMQLCKLQDAALRSRCMDIMHALSGGNADQDA
eukprot:1137646-Pelagomonas_calceolata.AAC.3